MIPDIIANDKGIFFLRGDRIAQLVIQRIEIASFVQVGELSESVRGAGGFGSTGGSPRQ